MAGGLGTRLQHRTGDATPKPLLRIGDKTLLDYCVEPYKRAGCRSFAFLLGHLGDAIKKYIDDTDLAEGAKFVIEEKRLGKGGALKNALMAGAIDRSRPSILIYPDDVILEPAFPEKTVEAHLKGVSLGCKVTIVSVDSTQYRFGWVKADENGVVARYEEKPWIPYPASVGIYVFEPQAYGIIDEKVDMSRLPVDFEDVVVPEFVRQRLLYTRIIKHDYWIPVNEEKEFRQAENALLTIRPLRK
jgi:NDP-sugar pyrophosphorylase family protein